MSSSSGGNSKRSQCTRMLLSYGNPSVEIKRVSLSIYPESLHDARSNMLCCISIPVTLSPAQISAYFQPFESSIMRMRLFRNPLMPTSPVAVLLFRDQASTEAFYARFVNQTYDMHSPEICELNYVQAFYDDFREHVQTGSMSPIFTASFMNGVGVDEHCPICLEELSTGVITLYCDHNIHINCLAAYSESACPLCRFPLDYMQDDADECVCMGCGCTQREVDSMWMCMTCGHVGCGRYSQKHAFIHFQESCHPYAMDLGTARVWDYTTEAWIDRLLEADGKDLDMSSPDASTSMPRSGPVSPDESRKLVAVDEKNSGAGLSMEQREAVRLEANFLLGMFSCIDLS